MMTEHMLEFPSKGTGSHHVLGPSGEFIEEGPTTKGAVVTIVLDASADKGSTESPTNTPEHGVPIIVRGGNGLVETAPKPNQQ